MNTASTLTDIYTQVLLSEGKKSVEHAKPVKKGNVVTKKQTIGDVELVGDGPEKVVLPQKVTPLTRKKSKSMESYNSFEKLFKSTINEENELEKPKPADSTTSMDFEVPTSNEEMADEIENTEDEVSDLVSDLRSVVDKLNDILEKISEEENEEEGEEEGGEDVSPEDEFNYEEGEDETEGENKNVKAVESVENHGTPLVNIRSGKDFEKKKKYVVQSKLKVKKGTAHTGKFTDEPEPKKLNSSEKELCNTKNSKVKTSNIKPGDFFK